ncbi:MAG: DUF448 domain-containing protein [Helicobacter sp.]|nr:DUF448 domain-containing protein [Helicobacteraceae bacterium]MDY3114080.1 DUF448 domain-containing protein [Helicobacter sp.]
MSNPIRMCVVCKGRLEQSKLTRLQYKDSKVIHFSGVGRSFYCCIKCQSATKLSDCILRTCKIDKKHKENIKSALKEIFLYG